MEKYYVIENRNAGLVGKPEFVETILFTGTKEECVEYEDAKRREYKDRTIVDCFIQSESERNRMKEINEFWISLTKEERKETIIVNGKKYYKALYDFHNGRRKERGRVLAHGVSSEIRDDLKRKRHLPIEKWEAYFNLAELTI